MSSAVSSQVGQTCPDTLPGQVGQVGQNTTVPPFAGIDAEGGGTSGTTGTPLTGGPRFVPPVCPGSLPLDTAEQPSVGAEIAYPTMADFITGEIRPVTQADVDALITIAHDHAKVQAVIHDATAKAWGFGDFETAVAFRAALPQATAR